MDSVTSFIYGMSMMFFSMMAFPVLEKRKGDALSDDYVAHDRGRPAVGKGHGFLSDLWF